MTMSNRMLKNFACVLTSNMIKTTRNARKFIVDYNLIFLAMMIVKIIRAMNQNSAFDGGKRVKLQRPIQK